MTENRADQVQGLRNELAYLERQPTPNKSRIDQVKKTLDRFESEPKQRTRETADAPVPDPEAAPKDPTEHVVGKPAKKTAAKKV